MSKFLQTLKMSLSSIKSNKLRSFLTMLGIIIGVSSVIVLTGIVNGSTLSIKEQIESLGTNMVTATIRSRSSSRTIGVKDIASFVNGNEEIVSGFSPNVQNQATVKFATKNTTSTVLGVSNDYNIIKKVDLIAGRFFNENDVESKLNVAIIGSYQVVELFDGENPINQKIKLNGESFYVIGVMEEKANSVQGSSDDQVMIPYTKAQRLFKIANPTTYLFTANNENTVSQLVDKLKAMLTEKLGNSSNMFTVNSQAEMMDMMDEMTGMLAVLLACIAGISLVVAGIGIMNIMLVSVTERTKEIGIRKAIGAKRSDILTQFMIEAVVLSSLGGILGVGVGSGLGYGASSFIEQLKFAPTTGAIMLSFSFSLLIGVFFGLYPASKASKLNPIEALRFE